MDIEIRIFLAIFPDLMEEYLETLDNLDNREYAKSELNNFFNWIEESK